MKNVLLAAGAVSAVLAVTACGATGPPPAAQESPHGYVAGAEELPEAQSAIAYATKGGTRLGLLDLATASEKQVTLSLGVQRLAEDGRFVYAGDGDRRVEIVDAGVWTVDHTDHVHYYRAPARSLGVVTLGSPVVHITGSAAHTTIGTADGRITVLDRRALEAGRITEIGGIDSRSSTALAVPYAENLLVAVGNDPTRPADRIVAMTADGRQTGAFQARCEAPRDAVVLRGGALIACADHVVRAKLTGDRLSARTVTSAGTPLPDSGFGFRPRSNEAALTGGDGIWSANAATATLRFVPAAGRKLAAAVSPADGRTVLALDTAGTLLSYDLAGGELLAQRRIPGGNLTLDINRAYLTEPGTRTVHEIDYRDGLRTARTLRVAERPDLAVEVGR